MLSSLPLRKVQLRESQFTTELLVILGQPSNPPDFTLNLDFFVPLGFANIDLMSFYIST